MNSSEPRGYFEIGIEGGKITHNLGTLWRSANQLGASGIFTIGQRYKHQASDTLKTWRHVPLRQHETLADFFLSRPHAAQLVAIEDSGDPLEDFKHPEQAIYILGSEDTGLSKSLMQNCQRVVRIPSVRTSSFNVATAGAIVMYDRLLKRLL